MYDGYLELGGNEILNASRVFGYALTAGCGAAWVRCEPCEGLRTSLDDDVYDVQHIADAPWYDPDWEASGRFYGAYPLSIEGIDDSTREADVAESILDGGTVGLVRHGTRRMTVRALLLAQGQDALEAGMTWLDSALQPTSCSTHGDTCGAVDMCFYTGCPPERGEVLGYTDWTTTAVNLAQDPRGMNEAVWWADTDYGTLSASQPFPDPAGNVSTAMRFTRTTTNVSGWVFEAYVKDFELGGSYRVRFKARASVDCTLTPTIVNTDYSYTEGEPIEVPANTIVEYTAVIQAPTSGVSRSLDFNFGDTFPAGTWFEVSSLVVEDALSESGLDFYDGYVPDTDTATFEWAGAEDASPTIYQSRRYTNVPEPLDDWEDDVARLSRHIHSVTAVSGPTIEQVLHRGQVWGYVVEFVLVAAVPWIYGETKQTGELDLSGTGGGEIESIIINDLPYNLVPVPNATVGGSAVIVATNFVTNPSVETGTAGWSTARTSTSGTAPTVAGSRSPTVAAGGSTYSYRSAATFTAAGVAQVTISYSVDTSTFTTGTRVSASVWASAFLESGAATTTGISADLTLGSEVYSMGSTTTTNGYVFSVKSVPVAGAATAVVTIRFAVTATAAAVMNCYADTLAVTVP